MATSPPRRPSLERRHVVTCDHADIESGPPPVASIVLFVAGAVLTVAGLFSATFDAVAAVIVPAFVGYLVGGLGDTVLREGSPQPFWWD